MANLVGQVGCVTAIVAIGIILIAGGVGWLIDDLLGNERRIVFVIMLLLSFPVTLFAMVRISLTMVGRTQKAQQKIQDKQNESQQKDDTTT